MLFASSSLLRPFAALAALALTCPTAFSANARGSRTDALYPHGVAHEWQRGFQTPWSPIAQGIQAFHDDLRIFLVGISFFVRYLLGHILNTFGSTRSEDLSQPVVRLVHAPTLEIVWTLLPAVILLLIAVPSFSLLYSVDEIIEPLLTVKVIGHQWYWSYEFIDPATLLSLYTDLAASSSADTSSAAPLPEELFFGDATSGSFDSYRLADDDIVGPWDFRLLSVDNRLILPAFGHIRARVSSADVIHSWAIPSLGVKLDACPGRINQASLFIKRQGSFYGQCSEICGVNHGFRPICITAYDFGFHRESQSLDREPLRALLQAQAHA